MNSFRIVHFVPDPPSGGFSIGVIVETGSKEVGTKVPTFLCLLLPRNLIRYLARGKYENTTGTCIKRRDQKPYR